MARAVDVGVIVRVAFGATVAVAVAMAVGVGIGVRVAVGVATTDHSSLSTNHLGIRAAAAEWDEFSASVQISVWALVGA